MTSAPVTPAHPPARGDVAPGSTSSLRGANQRRVLAVLQAAAGAEALSQAALARETGLAPATVSNIVRDLAAAELVETTVGAGRRGTTVRIARSAGLVAGIDIGHRHARVVVGDLTGEVLAHDRRPLGAAHPSEEGLDLVAAMLEGLVADLGRETDPGPLRSIGFGLPAPIARTSDGREVVMESAILPGWVGLDARQAAQERFATPVHVENDANLGALAEHTRGAGVGHGTMAFVKVSSGIGSGLIIGGEPFRGSLGTAGEIGHLTLDEQGPMCRCGSRGCLEAYASVGSIETLLAERLPEATFDEVVAAAADGNVVAARVFEDAGLHLGWGLAMLANLVNPSAIVVGGDLARAGDLVLDWVRVGLRRHALASVAQDTVVCASTLGDRASAIGALALAVRTVELIPAGGIG
ncbi:ROK family transcriptional regulator [Nocardioides sp. TRM66260-LWL]|uniref:ROK family transcriptional regulator n=1 Tax=Nocardioides sp. TRM66260-LWL TaxID=2874478 RepID=UPI001CC6FA7E|nr:ROK family transcriptional regulator [Nocardioides sp. TRM66260-LWL]MBZ5735157.1 ROK family transcriptional regulator [Nocardioides sp. TRM66260-LWL]